jgi:hypothetical protein
MNQGGPMAWSALLTFVDVSVVTVQIASLAAARCPRSRTPWAHLSDRHSGHRYEVLACGVFPIRRDGLCLVPLPATFYHKNLTHGR